MSSDMASQLTRRLEQHPNSRNHIDYKLGLLSRVRECLGTDVQASGQVDVILHFAVDPEGRSAKGTQIEITDSTLPPEVDRRLRQCATKLHLGQPITLVQMDAGSPVYYWGTKFVVPTEEDPIYGWFR